MLLYTFTGRGDWALTSNWAGGLMPPANSHAADTIYINGNAVLGPGKSPPCCPPFDPFQTNGGLLVVVQGDTLTLQNQQQFSNGGTMIALGSIVNKTVLQPFSGGSILIYGSFEHYGYGMPPGNEGLIEIETGGVWNNWSKMDNTIVGGGPNNPLTGTIIVDSAGTFNNPSIFLPGHTIFRHGSNLINTGQLVGAASVTGNLTNAGILAPGNSPGIYTIAGDYTATSSAIHNFEIAGTTSNKFDQLNVTGAVNLNGTLNVTLISGFVPSTSHTLPIITGSINGTFSSVNLPTGYSIVYNANNVSLQFGVSLPVLFESIEGRKTESGFNLEWKVAEEQNVDHYEILKSNGSTGFSVVGTVSANGSSSYNFLDRTSQGTTYYRVRSVDRDLRLVYSTILKYQKGTSLIELKVYPSPAHGLITIQHPTAMNGDQLSLLTLDGRRLRQITLSIGNQQTILDLSSLPAGVYALRYQDSKGNVHFCKLLKQ